MGSSTRSRNVLQRSVAFSSLLKAQTVFTVQSILVPRAREFFGQHQTSRPLSKSRAISSPEFLLLFVSGWSTGDQPLTKNLKTLRSRLPLSGPDVFSMRRILVLNFQPIRFARFDNESLNRGLLARGLGPWC